MKSVLTELPMVLPILNSPTKKEVPQLYSECQMGSSFVIPVM